MELQFITHFTDRYSYYDSARLALEGGCRWIQLRMKDASPEEREQEAVRIQELCRTYEATFIIDDDVELVKKLKADGVHLGKNDMPIAEARHILAKDFIIGGTANTFDDVVSHYRAGADYIGCGPFRFTTTKKNLSPILGLEGYRSHRWYHVRRYSGYHADRSQRHCVERNHSAGRESGRRNQKNHSIHVSQARHVGNKMTR